MVIDLLQVHRRVTMFAAPTMVKRLADRVGATGLTLPRVENHRSWRRTDVWADRLRAMRIFGPRLVEIYGQGRHQ